MYLDLPVTMSWHWTPPTRIPMIRNVHWIRDRYCMLGIRTSGRLVSYDYHLLPSFGRHRLKIIRQIQTVMAIKLSI